ncbi:MAG: ribosome maturation factor RimP [marine bacterium B5-7]|nr:MAG: ribosome maturation factor RimP [marine bacterium B5-7]
MRGLFFLDRVARTDDARPDPMTWRMLDDSTELRRLIEPLVEDLGYELLLVEMAGAGHKTLRLYIDAPGGVMLDDCESVSRAVSAMLDVDDPITGQYDLEVSSPGLERPLVREDHFRRHIGERVRVRLARQVLGRKRFTGILTEVIDNGIVVDVDGEAYALPFDDMESARLAPEYRGIQV